MKLRITSKSIRFRMLRFEVAKLIEDGCVQETIYFGSPENSKLSYSLRLDPDLTAPSLHFDGLQIAVTLPAKEAHQWAETEQVGIYTEQKLAGRESLEVSIEKDFACLDQSDAENEDTFPNPLIGVSC